VNRTTVLPVIVLSQFFCTSLWFAGNAIVVELQSAFDVSIEAVGSLTSAVQLGFIFGTLLFASLKIADVFSPSRVFLFCGLLGAMSNLAIAYIPTSYLLLLSLRFLTGFFLAGIYPIGMKIAADHHQKGLGLALGYLVGALVLGTAAPHLIRDWMIGFDWRYVLYATSGLAMLGALMIGSLVPDGPYRKTSKGVDPLALIRVFKYTNFRRAAFGYFGHMWELYAFWAFLPLALNYYKNLHPDVNISVPFWSFLIIGIGGISCVLGGYFSLRMGPGKVAFGALSTSLAFCLVSPLLYFLPVSVFLLAMMLWGMAVIADSPMFSTLVARHAPSASTGTALTITNSLGFALTIGSISLLTYMLDHQPYLFWWLMPGPLLGLISFRRLAFTG
jgi:predicted MFS family arabinose efflux permease